MLFSSMHLILLPVPGYELSSDEEEIQAMRKRFHFNTMIQQTVEVHWMTCSLKMGRPSYSSRLLRHHSTLLLSCAVQAGIRLHCWPQYERLMHIYHLDPSMYTVNVLEEL